MSGMFGVIVLIAYLTQQALATLTCNGSTVEHTVDLLSRCCQTTICPPGFQPNLCGSEGTLALCEPCPKERFNDMYLSSAPPSDKMDSCKHFTKCYPNDHREVFAGNATHDRICECLNGGLLGAYGKCYPNSTCSAGEYWQKEQSSCETCAEGKFKDVPGGQKCSVCTVCSETVMACNSTNNAVCKQGNDQPSTEERSGTKLPTGGIAAIVVVLLIALATVPVILCICRRRHGEWFRCRKSSSSSCNPTSSSDPPPSSRPNGTSPVDGENVPLTENGSANADNDPSTSRRLSRSTHGFSRRLAGYCCCRQGSHSPADVEQPESNGHDVTTVTTPLNSPSSEQTDDEIRQLGSPSAGNNGRLDHQLETDVTIEIHADVPSSVGSGVQSLGDGPPPGGNGHQPASIVTPPNVNEGQPSGVAGRSDPASSGDRDSGQDQGPRSVNDVSLCTYDQSNGDQSTSKDSSQSFVPQSGLGQNSGPNTLQETPNYDLKSDDESIIAKYISRMQMHYIDILKTLYFGVFFIGYLYQEKILTSDQKDDIMILRDQAGGNEKALSIIQKALRRTGDKAAVPFLNALVDRDSRQDTVALLIDPERAAELIRKRDDREIAGYAEDPGQRFESVRDVVDFGPIVPGSNAPNPNETPAKVPANGAHNSNETPFKDILENPQIDVTQKPDEDEDQWNDPCVSVTKCDHQDIR